MEARRPRALVLARPSGHADPGLVGALPRFRRLLGADHVVTDFTSLRAAESATYRTTQTIPAIVRPRRREDVAACLRIAADCRISLHPISRGRNWGYGSRVPSRDGAVLLDLSRMTRILAFDERLAYVTVEPGVTFRQLHRFL